MYPAPRALYRVAPSSAAAVIDPADQPSETAAAERLTPREREAVAFVQTLGNALHRFGAPANRLEDVMQVLSAELGLRGSFFSTPTAIFYAFDLPEHRQFARLVRVHGHELDLAKMAELDRLFNDVLAGRVELAEGTRRVDEIVDRAPTWSPAVIVLAFALTSGAAAAFFGGTLRETALGAVCGLVLALTFAFTRRWTDLGRLFEPLGALLVTLTAVALSQAFGASAWVATLAGLIALVPGFSLTIGATELALNHPASGVARIAAGLTTLLMLTMGVLLGQQLGTDVLGFTPLDEPVGLRPVGLETVSLIVAGLSIGVLFRTAARDLVWSVVAVVLPYAAFEAGIAEFGREASIFVGGLIAGSFANLFGRFFDRPSMIVRLPGILILVPGATGLLSLESIAGGDQQAGIEMFFRVAMTATALVAGFFAANVVVPPRKAL